MEDFAEEGARCDERQSADGSESGASCPADFLSQRGNDVRRSPLSSLLFESDVLGSWRSNDHSSGCLTLR
jgi:hypothetical protein